MEQRELGRSGIAVAPLVLGGNVFGWTAARERSFELLDHFIGHGFNAVDTADVYSAWAPGLSGGESEAVIGEWLAQRKRRDDVVLMTKVGMWEKVPVATPMIRMIGQEAPASRAIETPAAAATESASASSQTIAW